MKNLRLLTLLSAGLFASCASDKKSIASTEPRRHSLSERLNEKNGYKQDANGNWVPQNDKRSPFENKGQDANFTKNFKTKNYKTGDYAKKSWWGNKDYGKKSYAGNTDGSRFEKASGLDGKGAHEAGTAAKIAGNYKTNHYTTNNAREAGKNPIATSSNDGIENRRDSYVQPEVIDWRAQRTMSIGQSKSILGH